jgi:hypothetical protein
MLKNATLPVDATKMRDDFSKEGPPLHLSYPVASPAPAFRCKNPLTCKNSPPILPSVETMPYQRIIKQTKELVIAGGSEEVAF